MHEFGGLFSGLGGRRTGRFVARVLTERTTRTLRDDGTEPLHGGTKWRRKSVTPVQQEKVTTVGARSLLTEKIVGLKSSCFQVSHPPCLSLISAKPPRRCRFPTWKLWVMDPVPPRVQFTPVVTFRVPLSDTRPSLPVSRLVLATPRLP